MFGTLPLLSLSMGDDALNQEELLDLLARKDNRAYQHLYRIYYVALKALANYYVKDNDVAEDLVQDVFISLLESGYKFKTESEVKYFLYSSLKNKCISHFRKQKVRDKYHKEVLSSQTDVEHFWDKVLEEDVYARLMAAVDTLPPQCKMVMMLTLEGLKIAEIAEKMEISVDTVKEYKSNGKRKLISRLKDADLICLGSLICL